MTSHPKNEKAAPATESTSKTNACGCTACNCGAQPPIHNQRPIILPSDLKNMDQKYGVSVYRGIIVFWDEDHDERVLALIDSMPINVVDRLCVVQEHEGSISFIWSGEIPRGFEEGESINVHDGDRWNVYSTKSVQNRTTVMDGDNLLTDFLESNRGWWGMEFLCSALGTNERTLRELSESSAGRVIFSSGNGGLCATIHAKETERRNCAAELRRRANAHLTRAGEIESAARLVKKVGAA